MQAGRNDKILASHWATTGIVTFTHTLPDKLDNAVTNTLSPSG